MQQVPPQHIGLRHHTLVRMLVVMLSFGLFAFAPTLGQHAYAAYKPPATRTPVATPTDSAVPTNTAIPANTATPTPTEAPANTATPTNTAVPTNTATPANTATPTNTAILPTPALAGVDVAPRSAAPASTLVLSYTVTSPAAQQVSLGAGIRAKRGSAEWIYDPARDRTVLVVAGTTVVTREFRLPSTTNATYDVAFGLWSPGFITEYDLQQLKSVVDVSGPTPTPSVPMLESVTLAPNSAPRGGTIVLSYTVFSPVAQQVALGAAIAPAGSGQWMTDPANDTVIGVSAGSSTVSRLFSLGPQPSGNYDVRWGLWDPAFTTQYDQQDSAGALFIQVITATPTPSPTGTATATATNTPLPTATPTVTPTPTNTAPPTATPTPSQPVLLDVAAAPTATSPGTLLVLSYTVFSPAGQEVSLGAGLRQSGGGDWFYDSAHDVIASVPAGTSVVSRLFTIPSAPTDVAYDVLWGVWSPGFGTLYGLQERDNLVQVSGPPPTATPTDTPTHTPTPTITPTATSTIPPTSTPLPTQPALIAVDVAPPNPAPAGVLVLSYTVFSPQSQQVSLGAGLRVSGGNGGWFYDPANDRTLDVVAGSSVVTRSFTLPNTPDVTYDVIWGLWSAGFGTLYGLQQRDGAVTVAGPTPTPVVPTLQDVALAPAVAFANGSIMLTYTIFSAVGQQVALGAALAPAGSGQWVDDPARNLVVSLTAGTTVVSRQFNLGPRVPGPYDVRWGVWDPAFSVEYSEQTRAAALTISPITATPTVPATPTNTGTPTPTVTGTPPTATNTPISTVTPNGMTLLAVDLSPASGQLGGALTFSYSVYSPAGGPVVLAAQIRNDTDSYSDPGGDVLVTLPAGTTTVTRQFYISPLFVPGTYDVLWGLWDTCFVTQYAVQWRPAALLIGAAMPTATPLVQIPTPTATALPPVAVGTVGLGVTGPAPGQQLHPGDSLTLSYTVDNNTGSPASIRLVASSVQSGFPEGLALADTTHETTVTAPQGVSVFTRLFEIPATAGEGSYDLTWALVDPPTNCVLAYRKAAAYLWVATQAVSVEGVALGPGYGLSTAAITLQPGVVNRVSANFVIENESGMTAGVVLKLALRQQGTENWILDLPGDALVDIAPGSSTWTRTFAIPRYVPSGTFDVLWELGKPDLSGIYDINQVSGELLITNPAPLADVGVPILMYHNVNLESAGGNWVTLCNFAEQMAYLESHGYTAVDGEALYDYIYRGTPLPAQPVWLTFDDSYQNIYEHARAIMQAHGMRGSIFTVTRFMGQMNSWDLGNEVQHPHMSWDMLRALLADGQFPDSHTAHHVHLGEVPYSEQVAEVWGSQRDLVSFLGRAGLNFAYPYGQEPESAKWVVAHSGFQAATIIGQTKQYTTNADLYELARIGIADSDTLPVFISKLTAP